MEREARKSLTEPKLVIVETGTMMEKEEAWPVPSMEFSMSTSILLRVW